MKLLTPILAITIVAFAAAPCAYAQASPAAASGKSADSSAITAKLKQMSDAWTKALVTKDHAAVGNLLAEDFAGFSSEGKRLTKTALLERIKAETDTLSSSTNDSMEVHVYAPNLATVCGLSTDKGKDKDGKEFSRNYAWVDTWMERNGKWECIAEGSMQLPEKE